MPAGGFVDENVGMNAVLLAGIGYSHAIDRFHITGRLYITEIRGPRPRGAPAG